MKARQQVKHEARRQARRPGVERALRGGWAAKGVVFALTALLAAQVALGRASEQPSPTGALEFVGGSAAGTVVLLLLGTGLWAYALERFGEATVLAGGDDGYLQRAARLVTALAYAALGVLAVTTATGGGSASTRSSSAPTKATGSVLQLPGGRWLVAAVGAALLAYALSQAKEGLGRDALDDLRTNEMSRHGRRVVTLVSAVGLVGHGMAFALVGFFLVQSAVTYEASKAEGLDGALRRLAGEPFGQVLILLTAAGLAAYAAYCGLQARYREIGR